MSHPRLWSIALGACLAAAGACGPGPASDEVDLAQQMVSEGPEEGAGADPEASLGGGATGARHGWPLAGFDLAATGHNRFEHRLAPSNIDGLAVEWVFDAADAGMPVRPIHATPVVDGKGNVYVGDFGGTFFSISPEGTLRWSFAADPPTPEVAALLQLADGPLTASPFIGGAALATRRPYVVAGDANGRIYARHRVTGEEVWTARGLNPNPLGGVAGNSITIVGDTVLVGMGSLENYALVLTSGGLRVDCCAHRGAVVALDLDTGAERWRHHTVEAAQPLPASAAPFLLGPSGADIWSQPTYDAATKTVYISTGQNLSPEADGSSTPTSDAIMAIDFRTGARKWVHQFTENDIWAVGIENPNPVTGQPIDMDLGDAPKIYRLADGRKVVGAGQKDGRYHVLDAHTGAVVRTTAVIPPRNDLGGFQTGGAYADGVVFQHGLRATDGFSDCKEGSCPYEGFRGTVVALSADGGYVKWSLDRPVSPMVGGLAVANGLVYVMSPVEEPTPMTSPPEWALLAIDAETGALRKRIAFPGRALGSPVVADGHVYVPDGNAALAAYGQFPTGALMRLGLPGCDAD